MRKWPLLLLFPALVMIAGACQKKSFKFSGDETDVQAIEKCMKLSEKKKFQEAVECLEIFKSRFPDSTYALDAELNIADAYFRKKDWVLAAETYNLFTRLHPTSEKLDYAYYRAGLSYEKQLPKGIDRDLSSMNQAEENFAMVFRRFPGSPYAEMAKAKYDEVRGRGAKKDMYVGKFYFKSGQYRAAIPRFLQVLQEYPGLGYDEEALERTALAFHKLGEKEKAQGAAQLMREKFPDSKKTQKVLKKVGLASAPAPTPAGN
ncbi:outer membrane protein assembly factor BamD [Deltaproteobacteria bacterium PRO3]|nr:outer membrane protein assembly factor BamD [Deltaproteobacteria bacterium PRO3]